MRFDTSPEIRCWDQWVCTYCSEGAHTGFRSSFQRYWLLALALFFAYAAAAGTQLDDESCNALRCHLWDLVRLVTEHGERTAETPARCDIAHLRHSIPHFALSCLFLQR